MRTTRPGFRSHVVSRLAIMVTLAVAAAAASTAAACGGGATASPSPTPSAATSSSPSAATTPAPAAAVATVKRLFSLINRGDFVALRRSLAPGSPAADSTLNPGPRWGIAHIRLLSAMVVPPLPRLPLILRCEVVLTPTKASTWSSGRNTLFVFLKRRPSGTWLVYDLGPAR